MSKRGTFGPVQESRKLSFKEHIGNSYMTVEFNEVGWIHVKQFQGLGGFFGQKQKYATLHLTTEDARNLITCLSEFVPPQETEKGCPNE